MARFWPSGLNVEDSASPHEVLLVAANEWAEESGGLLNLLLQQDEENAETIWVVSAEHVPSRRSIELMKVIHRREYVYPVAIQLREESLPYHLRKSYYKPGVADLAPSILPTGRKVENEWVCDTAGEFRSRLANAFNLGNVKTAVANLVARAQAAIAGTGQSNALDAGEVNSEE